MQVTSSMVFHMLSRKYRLDFDTKKKKSIPIKSPRILRRDFISGTLSGFYICGDFSAEACLTGDDLEKIRDRIEENSVFLIMGRRGPLVLPELCDAAWIAAELSADELLYEVYEIIANLQEWDLALKDAYADSMNLGKMLQTVRLVLSCPIGIVDRNYISYDDETKKNFALPPKRQSSLNKQQVPVSEINDLLLDPAFVPSLQETNAFLYHSDQRKDKLLCMNIFEGGQYIARIIATLNEEPSSGLYELFHHACRYIRQVFLAYTDDILVKRQNDQLHALVSDLIYASHVLDAESIDRILNKYGWKLKDSYEVIVLRFENAEEFEHIRLYVCNKFEMLWPGTCAICGKREIVLVLNTGLNPNKNFIYKRKQFLAEFIREFLCKAGSGNSFSDFLQLRSFYEQAKFALEKGMARQPHLWYFHFKDYTVDYIMGHVSDLVRQTGLYHPGICRLMEYDRQNHSDYTEVLYTFILCNQNATHAAEKLFLHRSTFIRQMAKIREITGIDFSEQENLDQMLHLLLTLKLCREKL